MDIVFLRGVEIYTVIGAFEWEKMVQQRLILNLEMMTDVRKAAATDNLEDALNYSAISKRVTQLVEDARVQLVETLAERIADTIMSDFGVQWLRRHNSTSRGP